MVIKYSACARHLVREYPTLAARAVGGERGRRVVEGNAAVHVADDAGADGACGFDGGDGRAVVSA